MQKIVIFTLAFCIAMQPSLAAMHQDTSKTPDAMPEQVLIPHKQYEGLCELLELKHALGQLRLSYQYAERRDAQALPELAQTLEECEIQFIEYTNNLLWALTPNTKPDGTTGSPRMLQEVCPKALKNSNNNSYVPLSRGSLNNLHLHWIAAQQTALACAADLLQRRSGEKKALQDELNHTKIALERTERTEAVPIITISP